MHREVRKSQDGSKSGAAQVYQTPHPKRHATTTKPPSLTNTPTTTQPPPSFLRKQESTPHNSRLPTSPRRHSTLTAIPPKPEIRPNQPTPSFLRRQESTPRNSRLHTSPAPPLDANYHSHEDMNPGREVSPLSLRERVRVRATQARHTNITRAVTHPLTPPTSLP